MISKIDPHVVNFLKTKIQYVVWGGEDFSHEMWSQREISVAGLQTHAVDPSFILKTSHLFPCVYG